MKIITLITAFFASILLHAQVTITAADYSLPVSPDTAFGRVGQPLGIVLPAEGGNQTWDYSNMLQSVEANESFLLPDTNANFPNAQGMTVTDGAFGGLTIEDNKAYYRADADGVFYLGYQLKQMTYNMGSITGSTDDELDVVGEHKNFGNSIYRIKWPLTANSSWSNNYEETVPMVFRINGLGNLGDSVDINQYFEEQHEVVGWGSVNMPSNLGTYDALLLKSKVVRTDSIYVNGQVASGAFLAGSGLTQGDSVVTAYYQIMIRGLNRSAIFFGTDASYSTILAINFCTTPSVFGIAEEKPLTAQVYPNPTQSGLISIEFDKGTNETWHLDILDVTGKNVGKERITGQGKIKHLLELPVLPCVYLLRLTDENGLLRSVQRVVRN